MPNFKTIPDATAFFKKKTTRTIEGWLDKKYIKPYSDGTRIYVDCDEIERELKTNPHMRDGRQRFGGQPIIALPVNLTTPSTTEAS